MRRTMLDDIGGFGRLVLHVPRRLDVAWRDRMHG